MYAPRTELDQRAEERLAANFAAHEKAALEEAYRQYGSLLFSAALAILSNRSDAEDCVHDALLRAWTRQGYRAERGSLRAFLVVAVRNEALTRRRAMFRHLRIEQRLVNDVPEEIEIEDHVQAGRLRSALAALPPEQREVIELAYYQGLSQSAIAERVGAPLGTVKGRIALAMRKLRGALQKG